MSSPLLIPVGYQFLTNAGGTLSGGFLYTYVAGSSVTPQATYSDDGLSVLNPNPIPLNSAGRCAVSGTEINVYPIGASYKLVLTDSAGVEVWSHDQVDPAAAFNILTAVGITLTSPILITPTITSPTINTQVSSASALFDWVCQGRLTLTAGTPVTTADVTGATSVLFTPYGGNNIALFDGVSTWTLIPFIETSLPLGTLTSGLPYDVFGFNSGGVLGLELLAWTSTSARATALVLQNGVLSKTGATTRRYLGTFFTTSTTQTEDSVSNRYLWNYYNRVERVLQRTESTSTWTYAVATVRQANGSTANTVKCVIGVVEDPLQMDLLVFFSEAGGVTGIVGVGVDSTTVIDPLCVGGFANLTANTTQVSTKLRKYLAVGQHAVNWLEFATGATVSFFSGTFPATNTPQSGMTGSIRG